MYVQSSYDLMEAAQIPYNRVQTTTTKAGTEMVLYSKVWSQIQALNHETPNPGS